MHAVTQATRNKFLMNETTQIAKIHFIVYFNLKLFSTKYQTITDNSVVTLLQ
jgi:hypothetical protein